MTEEEILRILNKNKKNKKGIFSKFIVALVIMLNILFTIGVFIAALKGATIPDALIVAWFAFTTGELWMLSKIKRNKDDKEDYK